MSPGSGAESNILGSAIGAVRRCCVALIPSNDYPKLCREVHDVLALLRMTPRDVGKLYRVFSYVRTHDAVTAPTAADECTTASVLKLVRLRREWVAKILSTLLELGGFVEVISWNGFLYVLLRFCMLSKMELAQVMFYIIAREMKSWTVHYVTTTQLEEFYEDYSDCEVTSFNTGSISFTGLSKAKYRMVDFIELTYRFSQLINPCLHLQRSLQQQLPSLSYWRDYDRVKLMNQQITLDFFRVQKVTSLMELIRGFKEEASAPKQHNMEDAYDASSEIKRHPPVKADLPIPMPGPGPPGWKPPRAERPEPQPEMPSWLMGQIKQNADPKTGLALGTAALKDPPPNWALPLGESMTVKQARDIILASHRKYDPEGKRIVIHQEDQRLLSRSDGALHDMSRNQELDFVRKSRGHEMQRSNMVACVEEVSREAVIPRKPRLFLFP